MDINILNNPSNILEMIAIKALKYYWWGYLMTSIKCLEWLFDIAKKEKAGSELPDIFSVKKAISVHDEISSSENLLLFYRVE